MLSRLSDCDIAIVKHTYTPTGGAEQELLSYLLPRSRSVAYVSHPFADARGTPLNTKVSFYEGGQLKEDILAPLIKGPFPLMALKDMLFTLWYLRSRKRAIHLYIGVDNLNALSGIVLKRLGSAQRVIYYVIDYAPERFSRRFMQSLYRALDRWCCYGSDAVWNVSAAMEGARREHGVKPELCAPQIEVPLGSRYHEIPKPAPGERRDNLIVFLGNLTREQGLHLMVEAMPEIRNRIPQARLRVIGDGPELTALKEMAREIQVEDSIEFLGFIEDDAKAASLVSEGVAAVAPYTRDRSSYKRFADPGKVKIYLAAGLPVVICRVPPVAGLVESSGAGIAVEPSARIIAESVVDLLSSPEKMRAMSERALELGKSFDWTGIFDRAFEQTFTCWEG